MIWGLSYKDEFPDWNDARRPNQMGFDEYCLWQLTRGRKEGERFSDPLTEDELQSDELAYYNIFKARLSDE